MNPLTHGERYAADPELEDMRHGNGRRQGKADWREEEAAREARFAILCAAVAGIARGHKHKAERDEREKGQQG